MAVVSWQLSVAVGSFQFSDGSVQCLVLVNFNIRCSTLNIQNFKNVE
jgi:hypothetical protein